MSECVIWYLSPTEGRIFSRYCEHEDLNAIAAQLIEDKNLILYVTACKKRHRGKKRCQEKQN